MNRKYYVFRDTVLVTRHLTFNGAVKTAREYTGDVRVVNSETKKVVWVNGGIVS